ncbi:hypothetical protein Pint_12218 [Pistacia integerrima]|uniref:Uncharacterized protein n=1 Tax=Pistacia integerrima TaxID=434235 RepID=A0ACC0XJF0_9ROSI|nr:hypothetical protein Pint_12218 [Pistacia integerrima]
MKYIFTFIKNSFTLIMLHNNCKINILPCLNNPKKENRNFRKKHLEKTERIRPMFI